MTDKTSSRWRPRIRLWQFAFVTVVGIYLGVVAVGEGTGNGPESIPPHE